MRKVAHRQQTATALPAVCNKIMRFCLLLAVGQLFPEDENGGGQREEARQSKDLQLMYFSIDAAQIFLRLRHQTCSLWQKYMCVC